MNFEHPYYCDEKLVDFLLYKNGFKIIKKNFIKKIIPLCILLRKVKIFN